MSDYSPLEYVKLKKKKYSYPVIGHICNAVFRTFYFQTRNVERPKGWILKLHILLARQT